MIHHGRISGLLLVALLGGCGEAAPPSTAESAGATSTVARPNVLVYLVDTLRADSLGCYGHPRVETPALDRFASGGTLFEHAFAQSVWTRPSVASLLSGNFPAVHGSQGRGDRLSRRVELLPEAFEEAGYATCCITTNPQVGAFFGFDQGYGQFIELYARREAGRVKIGELTTTAEEVTARALEWLEDAPRPFFLLVHTIDPHAPYEPPPGFDRYGADIHSDARGKPRWIQRDDLTDDDRARIQSLYFGEVSFADSQFGRLIEHLEDRGLLDETVCVFTSDHGEEFWEHGVHGHGETLHDDALHVPLILRYPGRVGAGVRVTDPVSSIDVFPTLLDLTGVPLPGEVDGRSLLDVGGEPREVFASQRNHGRQLVSLRRGGLKLIWDLNNDRLELFDVEADPDEEHDLAQERPDALAELRARTEQYMERNRSRFERLVGDRSAANLDELPDEERAVLETLGYMGEDDEGDE